MAAVVNRFAMKRPGAPVESVLRNLNGDLDLTSGDHFHHQSGDGDLRLVFRRSSDIDATFPQVSRPRESRTYSHHLHCVLTCISPGQDVACSGRGAHRTRIGHTSSDTASALALSIGNPFEAIRVVFVDVVRVTSALPR